MNRILMNAQVGRKNIVFGLLLFLVLGVVVGVPLTIDLLGGSLLSADEYQMWKVVHGYGVFLSFINYFFGLLVDRLNLTRPQKEAASWSFLIAGLIGGVTRMILVLTSALNQFGIYASLGESICFVIGTVIFVRGQMKEKVAACQNVPRKRAIQMPDDAPGQAGMPLWHAVAAQSMRFWRPKPRKAENLRWMIQNKQDRVCDQRGCTGNRVQLISCGWDTVLQP